MPYNCIDCKIVHYNAELCNTCKIRGNMCPKKCKHLGFFDFNCIDLNLSADNMVKVRNQIKRTIFN